MKTRYLILLFSLLSYNCSNQKVKSIETKNFPVVEFDEEMVTIEILKCYPFTGNKIFTKNGSNLFLCKIHSEQDTILVFDLETKVPFFISDIDSPYIYITNKYKLKIPNKINVTYPDTFRMSSKYRIYCGKIIYLMD
jgi:hypothetical protein